MTHHHHRPGQSHGDGHHHARSGHAARHGGHRHGGHHDHGGDAAHALLLELEARTFTPALEQALERAATAGPTDPRHVVDLGSGPGVGTLALARRFPAARVTAVDRSPEMLERVLAAAREAGVSERVRAVEADLDAGLPDLGPLDVVWASSSLHHVADPAATLTRVGEAVAPGGLLVVVESDGMPRFLPHDAGAGRPGLEDRCREVAVKAGWNAYPDWSEAVERAGFGPVERWTVTAQGAPGEEAARYARLVLERVRGALEDQLAPDDVEALERLLSPGDPAFVGSRRDVVPRSVRTVWAARRN